MSLIFANAISRRDAETQRKRDGIEEEDGFSWVRKHTFVIARRPLGRRGNPGACESAVFTPWLCGSVREMRSALRAPHFEILDCRALKGSQ